MKLLFFANRTPYPPYRGDKLKIYNLAKRLSKSHELHLLTFAQTEEDLSYQKELEKVFTKVNQIYLPKWKSVANCFSALWRDEPLQVLYFRSSAMQKKLSEVLSSNTFDAIHVQHLRMSPYLQKEEGLPRILDLPDAFSLYWHRRATTQSNPVLRVFEQMEYKRVLDYEKIIDDYNLSLVCSKEDEAYLKEKHTTDNVSVLPNGVDLDTFSYRNHDYLHNHTLLFTGNMDYAPNVDAAIYFTTEILPEITKAYPNVKFIIAGQRPVKKVQELASENVVITGFVEDIAAMYDKASVVVAPLRFGAGTQNKVLEAMAMGIPVVCSNIGFNGLGISSGEGAFMKVEKKAFIKQVLDLLASEELRRETGLRGKDVIHERFGWEAIAKQLEGYFEKVISS